MAKFSRLEVVTKMMETGMVPLFYHKLISSNKVFIDRGYIKCKLFILDKIVRHYVSLGEIGTLTNWKSLCKSTIHNVGTL